MQTPMKAEKPRKQAISGHFWADRTYRGRIKDDHKIDLAVGSGAFLLGMLNEITKAREVLTAYLNFGKDEKIVRRLYDLKIETIKNSIFACDIESSAVDIAKLRLWLGSVRWIV